VSEQPEVIEYHTELQGDWRLVKFGTWEISVGPDGLLMLPRYLRPQDWDDFIAAGAEAVQIGTQIIAANEAAAAKDDRRLPPGRAIVTPRGQRPPAGTVPMIITPTPGHDQPHYSTIGRPSRGMAKPFKTPGPIQ
jgi:hypothetical protein